MDSRDACLLPDELFVREIDLLRGACIERIPGSWLGDQFRPASLEVHIAMSQEHVLPIFVLRSI
jgi:hypothetical protein